MFGLVYCNASIIARQNTDPYLYFVRNLVKNWLWPIITFFGVTGNILAIIVLTKRRMIMSSTNNYLVALACVDIAYLVLTLILNTLQNPCFTNTSISEIALTVCRPIADFSSNTSVWLTVTFTVERWVAITYPLRSRTWCTVHRARKIILSVMCASLICTSPSAFEMKLERVTVKKNISDQIISMTYIKAKPTALGNSRLYHQIYFNFVTFAIIWIPLLLLLIFNTILISYVRRSKQSKEENKEGVQLRRHTGANQSEQRKTTIMLIAVVLVFTVCQIPQAISLTLQSFFPTLSQSPKVLIYNNFANCLVALNASINFLLYCCFSARFRLTFQSNFSFLSKYCVHYMQPKWKPNETNYPTVHSTSVDNISNCSPHGNHHYIHTRGSNISSEYNSKYLTPLHSKCDTNERSWFTRLSKLKITNHRKLVRLRKKPKTNDERTLQLVKEESPVTKYPSKSEKYYQTIPLYTLNRSTMKSKLKPKFYSYRSVPDNNKEPIWVKRHQSHGTIEQLLNRECSSSWNEIIDVTV